MSGWLKGMGPGVGNHLWQTTAFAAVAWVVTLLLRESQARVRYAVWMAAS
jgi:bla regulator protein BlaR1